MAAAPQSDCDPNSASPPSRIPEGAIAHGFALSGASSLPDPATNAFRKDLADAALAGRVIASHYAEPLLRRIVRDAVARSAASTESPEVAPVQAGQSFRMLDCSLGWAWGYLEDGRVAYVDAGVVAA